MFKYINYLIKNLRHKPVLKIPQASKTLDLYDSDNGKTIKSYKIVDATYLCKDSKRCVIKYADCTRGRIAQICDWYQSDYDLGVSLHFFINEMTFNELKKDTVFIRRCKVMECDPYCLAKFIYDNQQL